MFRLYVLCHRWSERSTKKLMQSIYLKKIVLKLLSIFTIATMNWFMCVPHEVEYCQKVERQLVKYAVSSSIFKPIQMGMWLLSYSLRTEVIIMIHISSNYHSIGMVFLKKTLVRLKVNVKNHSKRTISGWNF